MTERGWTTSDFDYPLPEELVAQHPAPERGHSRLLLVQGVAAAARGDAGQSTSGTDFLQDSSFEQLSRLIPAGDLLVVNSSRVRHARLPGRTSGGAAAEVLLIHPASGDEWIAMGRPGRAMRPGRTIWLSEAVGVETTAVLPDGLRRVRFVGADASSAIQRFGQLPLPPYIRRGATEEDELRYQTVYAAREGSVAAPTAGLHFTAELLERLRQAGVTVGELDLEVGPGTFKPVEGEAIAAHQMHREFFDIPAALGQQISQCRARGGRVWAVGTTVVRALESAAVPGGQVRTGPGSTALFITPGFRFQVVDRLITNFHLPRSTLLMLVAAFAGYQRTMAAYSHAVASGYRFYSYGDAMCIVPLPDLQS